MSCHQDAGCNCKNNCPSKYPYTECCSENGNESYGMWVEEGNCNRKTGLVKKCNRQSSTSKESFSIESYEGYNNKGVETYIGYTVVTLLVLASLYILFRGKR